MRLTSFKTYWLGLSLLALLCSSSCDPVSQFAHLFRLPLSYCSIYNNPKNFNYSKVRLKAQLSGDDSYLIIADVKCRKEIPSLFESLVLLNPATNQSQQIRERLRDLRTVASGDPYKVADVVITGTFIANVTSGCWNPPHNLVNATIEQISEPRLMTLPSPSSEN